MRTVLVVLGLGAFYVGILQLRVLRLSRREPRHVQVGVGGLATSRLLAGVAFVTAGIVLTRYAILVAAISVIVGGVIAGVARRRLPPD